MNWKNATIEAVVCAKEALEAGGLALEKAYDAEHELKEVRDTLSRCLPRVTFDENDAPLLPDYVTSHDLALEVFAYVHQLESVLKNLIATYEDPENDLIDSDEAIGSVVSEAKEVLELEIFAGENS